MSSQPEGPVAPRHDYDALFGDEVAAPADAPDAYDSPVGDAAPYLPPNAPEHRAASEPPVDEAPVEVPARTSKPAMAVDTGRLYHSAGATGVAATGALPALRDRSRTSSDIPAEPLPVAAPSPEPAKAAPGPTDAAEPAPTRFDGVAPAPGGAAAFEEHSATAAATGEPTVTPNATTSDARGLTYLGVVIVVGVPTLLVGFAQAIISDRIGWLTGLVLLVTSCYAALTVRAVDRSAAIVVPPLAFLVTTLVAGQLTLTEGRSWLIREGFMIFRTLAENAPWILGATALSAVIVLVRRSRASRAG